MMASMAIRSRLMTSPVMTSTAMTSTVMTSQMMACGQARSNGKMRPRTGGRTAVELLIIAGLAVMLMTALVSRTAQADVFQWQWADPNDHSLGKVQSSILCPDGAGQTAGPGSSLGGDLTKAYLYSFDLSYSSWFGTTLNDAYFGKAKLNEMLLYGCSLRTADFTA